MIFLVNSSGHEKRAAFYCGHFKNLRGHYNILLLLIQHMFPKHLAVQGSVLGATGSTETRHCWPLSQSHGPSWIMMHPRETVRRPVRVSLEEGGCLLQGEGRLYICVDTEFSPVLSLPINIGNGPDYGFWASSQPVLCILGPRWLLGEMQTQLKIHICSVCCLAFSIGK